MTLLGFSRIFWWFSHFWELKLSSDPWALRMVLDKFRFLFVYSPAFATYKSSFECLGRLKEWLKLILLGLETVKPKNWKTFYLLVSCLFLVKYGVCLFNWVWFRLPGQKDCLFTPKAILKSLYFFLSLMQFAKVEYELILSIEVWKLLFVNEGLESRAMYFCLNLWLMLLVGDSNLHWV